MPVCSTLPEGYVPDFIIVGGGAAGCVLGARLSEYLPDKNVLIIEMGPTDVGETSISVVKDWWKLLEGDFPFIRNYDIVNKPSLKTPRAQVLGGCTSHNTSLSFRTFTKNIQEWEELGVTGWSVETVNRCLNKLPTEIKRIDPATSNELFKDWVNSCSTGLNIPEIVDFNETIIRDGGFGSCVGYFSVAFDPITGDRCSASVAYIHPLIKEGPTQRKNLLILINTIVDKITLTDDKTAVKSIHAFSRDSEGGPPFDLSANCEVILAAGAIDTPHLLLCSGIGPKEQFEPLDIPLQLHVPGVGNNLQDHCEGTIMWSLKKEPPEQTVVHSDAGIFMARTENGDADLMMHSWQYPIDDSMHRFAAYSNTMTRDCYDYYLKKETKTASVDENPRFAFAMQPNTPQPRSRGSIYLTSKDIKVQPAIDFNYFSDTEGPDGTSYDLQTLVDGVKAARIVAQQEPFKSWIAEEYVPGAHVTSDQDLGDHIKQFSTTVYHPSCTTKMGSLSDPLTVIDSNMRFRGVKNLRICDAGSLPHLTTINPMLTILAMSERGSELIAQDHGWSGPKEREL